jgi:hypothetical protein
VIALFCNTNVAFLLIAAYDKKRVKRVPGTAHSLGVKPDGQKNLLMLSFIVFITLPD